jgi:hypothetical protein
MQYHANRALDPAAPKAHALIAFGVFRVISMSYISDTTFAQAWEVGRVYSGENYHKFGLH